MSFFQRGLVMIRHILFWKYSETVKKTHTEKEALATLQASVATLKEIPGVLCVEMKENLVSEGCDLVFYSEFAQEEDVKVFQNHPLHEAHKIRCKDLVCDRECADIED